MGSQTSPRPRVRPKQAFTVQPSTFVFFDRITRTYRFEVKANNDGTLPTAEAARLLAMHCVMRGQTPADFGVMAGIDGDQLNGLDRHAQRLINACVTLHFDVRLSRRQRQVLRCVLQELNNKQIAGQLEISVRTVKFHISALLTKFGVTNRIRLAQKAGSLMSGAVPSASLTLLKPPGEPATLPPRTSREDRPHLNLLGRRSHG